MHESGKEIRKETFNVEVDTDSKVCVQLTAHFGQVGLREKEGTVNTDKF